MENKCIKCQKEISHHLKWCSKPCYRESVAERKAPNEKCFICGQEIYVKNFKRISNKSGLFFCSKAHKNEAQRVGGALAIAHSHPRNEISCNVCECGEPKSNKSIGCQACKTSKVSARSLGYMLGLHSKGSSLSFYRQVNAHARSASIKSGACQYCGYTFYTEVCHKKSISEFPMTATLLEVNDPRNLVELCPNHHKEQEAGAIDVSGFSMKPSERWIADKKRLAPKL